MDKKTIDLLEELVSAIRSISHGPASGPMGLEALAMALDGETMSGFGTSGGLSGSIERSMEKVADSGSEIASAIEKLAYQLERIADRFDE